MGSEEEWGMLEYLVVSVGYREVSQLGFEGSSRTRYYFCPKVSYPRSERNQGSENGSSGRVGYEEYVYSRSFQVALRKSNLREELELLTFQYMSTAVNNSDCSLLT